MKRNSKRNRDTNPYLLTETAIKDPPKYWIQSIKYLGPGLVLSASIVGSGELIATTTLGAKAGFVTLWIILISCLVKVAIQLEFGKHAINCGESTIASFSKLPGPRLGNVHWSIFSWLILMVFKFLQFGGIVGGVALTLNIAFPGISVSIWTLTTAVTVSLLVFRGYYRYIEKLSLIMIALFALFTIASLVSLQFTPFAISWKLIWQGLQFKLPPETVGVAIAAFGITGVGGDEIMHYPYWCLEKGYASFTGPKQDNQKWLQRARGWIRVMYIDALVSMVIYTVITAAFYLLGASILHGQGDIPQGYAMVETLSKIYTETLGPWARGIFLVGAIVVLFSTLFAVLAGWTRVFADASGQIGIIDFYNPISRNKAIAVFAWLFPIIWSLFFLFIKRPVLMVLFGGIGTAILLLLVVFVAFHYRYRRLSKALQPGKLYDGVFWLSAVVIVFVGLYGIYKVL